MEWFGSLSHPKEIRLADSQSIAINQRDGIRWSSSINPPNRLKRETALYINCES